MTILSKADNFELHNSLNLSSSNIRGLRSNSVECESLFESNSPDILAPWETNLDDSIDLCEGLSSFNLKRFYCSYVWSYSLYERRNSFCAGLISRKFCGLLLMNSTSFTSLGVLFLFLLSITFFVVMHGF